eukprot:TRINITY_DN3920_c0_g1_i1.p1 TRINITY_DN3920_c0_g1~~TRINITY_DN3920_c0_g1_i1.p1  ORF type:complete len:282 (-),score=58.28 TRINITY_DN3920_c0_g1_i1:296-1108(-)
MKFLWLCFFLLSGLFSQTEGVGIITCPSLSDVILQNQDLTIFASLVENVEDSILRTFERPAQRVATFAPTDDAWNKLEAAGILISDITSNNTLLNIVLKQHILKSVPSTTRRSSISGELETLLEGSPLTTTSGLDTDGQIQVLDANDDDDIDYDMANILKVEESCLGRGLVFVVDQVLIPPELSATLASKDTPQIDEGDQDTGIGILVVDDDYAETPLDDKIIDGDEIIGIDGDPIFFNPLLNDQKETAAATVAPDLQEGEDPIFFNPRL